MSRRGKRRGGPRRTRAADPGTVRADITERPGPAPAAVAAPPGEPRQPQPPTAAEPLTPTHHHPPGSRARTPAAAPQAAEPALPRATATATEPAAPQATAATAVEPAPLAPAPDVPEGDAEGHAASTAAAPTATAAELAPDAPLAPAPDAPEPVPAAEPAPPSGTHEPRSPEEAFDRLYTHCAGALARQVELLTGDEGFARVAVARAFDLAWQRWPEVARDPDPVGWVRAAAYECALSPWPARLPGWLPQRLVGRHARPRTPDDPVAAALLDLPPVRRRAVLLHDAVGLELPDAAAEMEASTVSAAGRVALAREELARAVPEQDADAVPARLSALLATAATPQPPQAPARVRGASERAARRRTAATLALTCAIALAALVAVLAGPGTGSRLPHHDAVRTTSPRGAPHDAPHDRAPAPATPATGTAATRPLSVPAMTGTAAASPAPVPPEPAARPVPVPPAPAATGLPGPVPGRPTGGVPFAPR